MSRRTVLLLPTMLVLCTAFATAQFTPVIAKIKQTEQTIKDGNVVESQSRQGVYLRASNGSVLQYWTSADGNSEASDLLYGDLWDNKTGTSYRLNMGEKTAYVVTKHAPTDAKQIQEGMLGPKATAASGSQETVGGVVCNIFPLIVVAQTKKDVSAKEFEAGTICTSVPYTLMLRRDMTIPSVDGKSVHTVWELSDVKLGSEPDPALFDVSKTFKITSQSR